MVLMDYQVSALSRFSGINERLQRLTQPVSLLPDASLSFLDVLGGDQSTWFDALKPAGVTESFQSVLRASMPQWNDLWSGIMVSPLKGLDLESLASPWPQMDLGTRSAMEDIADLIQPRDWLAEIKPQLFDALDLGSSSFDFLSQVDFDALPTKSMGELQADFLSSIETKQIESMLATLAEAGDLADLEEIGESVTPDGELRLFYQLVVPSAVWLAERFPELRDSAVHGANVLVAYVLWTFWIHASAVLYMVFDAPGLVASAVIFGAAKVYDDRKRMRLSPEKRQAIQMPCLWCGVPANMWCITRRGNNPGSTAQGLHLERIWTASEEE